MKVRWQDWAMLALGAWLFFAPFWMPGYASAVSTAAWNSYVLGILVMIFAIVALASAWRWPDWIELVLGIWLVVSPFIMLFFQNENGARWNCIFVGLLIFADSVWAMAPRIRRRLPEQSMS